MKTCVKSGGGSLATIEPPTSKNKAAGGDQTPKRLIPVLRKKRADWSIPRINEQELLQAEQDELEHIQELFRGTTPMGRELYRKILCGIRYRLRQPRVRIKEVIAYARSEFRVFPSLESEFKKQFLMNRGNGIDPGAITLDGMAFILVVREKARLVLFGRLPLNGCVDHVPRNIIDDTRVTKDNFSGPIQGHEAGVPVVDQIPTG